MKLWVLDILKEKGKTKYWLYSQLGLSYQNFNRLVSNETKAIRFDTLEALLDILDCTPNDLSKGIKRHKTTITCRFETI